MDGDECYSGAIVEVCIDEEGFEGSYYTATVIYKVNDWNVIDIRKRMVMVEYHTLMDDEDRSMPLMESVSYQLLRPVPPRELNRTFSVDEEVDAFVNDGWWVGRVTEVIHPQSRGIASSSSRGGGRGRGGGRNKYSVFFSYSRETLVFSGSKLRLHREWWSSGQWVPPLEVPQEQQLAASDIAVNEPQPEPIGSVSLSQQVLPKNEIKEEEE